MKVGILTQTPALGYNYGGILQTYALTQVLKQLKLDCQVVDIRNNEQQRSLLRKSITFVYRLLKKIIFQDTKLSLPWQQYDRTEKEFFIIDQKTISFVSKHLNLTGQIYPRHIDVNGLQLDAYIVGSDQVWRPKYSPYQPHFFLDFVKDKTNIKRVAYAASFGVEDNEFSNELLGICRPLAQKFDAISVREDSGIKLCKELFDVNAIQVLDPTLLLDAEHYAKLSFERNDFQNDGDLFTYVLDESKEKQNIIDVVINHTDLKPFRVLPKAKFREVGPKHIEDCVLPPVEQWLRAFVDAKYVVTDSFHGTVFSILFKRPFIAIGNSSRGMTRFTSLLKLFGLEERLVLKPEDVTEELIKKPIDYDRVYKILEIEREKSKKFLLNALNIKK